LNGPLELLDEQDRATEVVVPVARWRKPLANGRSRKTSRLDPLVDFHG
jgi:hypothetical protein